MSGGIHSLHHTPPHRAQGQLCLIFTSTKEVFPRVRVDLCVTFVVFRALCIAQDCLILKY